MDIPEGPASKRRRLPAAPAGPLVLAWPGLAFAHLARARSATVAPGPSPSPGLAGIQHQLDQLLHHPTSVITVLAALAPVLAACIVVVFGTKLTARVSARQEQKKLLVGQVQAVPPLLAYLSDASPPEVVRMATAALCRLGNADLVSDILTARGGQVAVDGLRRLERQSGPLYREQVLVTHAIAARDGEPDQITVHVDMAALSSAKPVRWRRIGIGATSQVGRHPSFAAARFQVGVEDQRGVGPSPSLSLEPILEKEGEGLHGRVVFRPPVGTQGLRWRYSYEWLGLWSDLRSTGSDHGTYAAGDNLDRIELRFAFPPTMANPRLIAEPPGLGVITAAGDGVIAWVIQEPRGTLSYQLSVELAGPGPVAPGPAQKPSGWVSSRVARALARVRPRHRQ